MGLCSVYVVDRELGLSKWKLKYFAGYIIAVHSREDVWI